MNAMRKHVTEDISQDLRTPIVIDKSLPNKSELTKIEQHPPIDCQDSRASGTLLRPIALKNELKA